MAFHGLVFVFRPLLVWLRDYGLIYEIYRFTPSPGDKITALVASSFGLVCFAYFALRSGGVAMRFKQDVFVEAERERLKSALIWVLAICVPIGAYSMLRLYLGIESGEGYVGMVRDKATGVFVNTTGNGYLWEAQLMLASCGAIVAWIFRFRLLAVMPLAVFVVFRAGSGGRGPFVTAMVTAALLYFYERKVKFPGLKILLFAAVLLAGFSLVGEDRGRSIRTVVIGSQEHARETVSTYSDNFMEGMDFANLEFFEYLVYVVPQRSGTYDYFLENLQLFTEPIPRVLWHGKPVGAPIKRIMLFDYGTPHGMTKSLPGQGWFFLGWFGVAIWCSLWGYGLGWLYRRFVEGPQNSLHVAAYMIFLPIMVVAYRDGTILTIFRQSIFFLAPIVVWLFFARLYSLPTAHDLRIAAFRRWRKARLAALTASGR